MRTALPRPQAPDVHGPHTPRHAHFVRTPPSPLPRPRPGLHALVLATVTWRRRDHAPTSPWPTLPRTPLALVTATR